MLRCRSTHAPQAGRSVTEETHPIMITRNQLDLLWNIEISCRRCIRASHCFDTASGTNRNLWAFTQNCYGGICVIHWCQVFGAWSEPTHYSKLFADSTITCISKDRVAARLRSSVSMTVEQYEKFWNDVKATRDKYLVHNQFDSADRPLFPDLDLMMAICTEMRDIICEIITAEQSEDERYRGDIEHFLSHNTNDKFLQEIRQDLPSLATAVSRT